MVFKRHPLDLNNLPDDQFISKQPLDHSSSAANNEIYRRKKKNSTKDEKGKVYECRFCSLKFPKSQALGGHMNRHRQEREAEALNQARQLVFRTNNMPIPRPQLGGQPTVHGGYHHAGCYNMGGVVYPIRLFSSSSTTILAPPPPHPHMYTSLAAPLYNADSSQYSNTQLINGYFVDQYFSTSMQSTIQLPGFEIRRCTN